MHPQIRLLLPLRLLLLNHIRLMLIVNEIDNRSPAVTVVHVVPETGRVDDREFDFELFLFELGFDDLDVS